MTQLTDRPVVPADTGVLPVIDTGIDTRWLGEYLLGNWADARKHSRELLLNSDFHRIDGLSVEDHRKRVFWQLGRLVEENSVHRAFPKSVGGQEDHGGNIASFEELVLGDPSLQIKSGVQWGLFGAAVMHLGTERHHSRLLPDILREEAPHDPAHRPTDRADRHRRDDRQHHGRH